MFGSWTDFERTVAAMDQLRRRMERTVDGEESGRWQASWPRMVLSETPQALTLKADLPGVRQEDLDLSLTQDVLTVSGVRRVDAPEGYSAHRRERTPLRFARSFTLPCRVNAEDIAASLKDGVLTVTLPKTPESKPRQITVKTIG